MAGIQGMCSLFVLVENSHLAHIKGSISRSLAFAIGKQTTIRIVVRGDSFDVCERGVQWAPDILRAILMHFMLFYFNSRAFRALKRQYNGRRRLTVHAFVHTKNVYLNLVWLVRARVSFLLCTRPSYIAAAEACFFAAFQMLFIRCRRFSAQNTMSAPNFGPLIFCSEFVLAFIYRERKREREKLDGLKIGLLCCFVLSEIV